MSASIVRLLMAFTCAACLAACADQHSSQAPASWDGLEKRDVRGLDAVYVRSNVSFRSYQKVMLDPAEVAFSKNWDPNGSRGFSQRLDSSDLQKIKETLAAMFREEFTKQLSNGGYEITDQPNDGVIRVTAALVDIYIAAPDVISAGRSRTYTTDSGSMTLVMEVRDAPSGQLLARVVDRRNGDKSHMSWTNSVTNRADAIAALDLWADKLRSGLDRLNGKGG